MTEERKTKSCAGCASWILMGSVALNLFLVGLVVGPLLGPDQRPPFEGREPPRGPNFMLESTARELAPAEAEKLRAIFTQEHQGFQSRHAEMQKTMGKLAAILKDEKPDMEALRKVLDEIRASGQGLHEGMGHVFERIATELSPEARRKIAQVMERREDHNAPPPPPPQER